MMGQIFLFIGIKVVTYRMRSSWCSVSESKFRVQFKNPTFTRKAGKNNIKIMKKISALNLYIKRRLF